MGATVGTPDAPAHFRPGDADRPTPDHTDHSHTLLVKTATEPRAEAPSLPAVDPSEGADPPSTDVSWVDRCQRQFTTDDDRRLRNLVDDENCVVYDGV
jgi:hypothetical protein